MFYALSWFAVFSLLALWSLAAWAFHAIAAWTVSNAGVLAGGSSAIEGLRVPDWLAPWIPPEIALALTSMVSALTPAVDSVLGLAPALAGGLSVAVWVVWGIGSVVLIVLGFVATGLIAVLRRRASMLAGPARGPTSHGLTGSSANFGKCEPAFTLTLIHAKPETAQHPPSLLSNKANGHRRSPPRHHHRHDVRRHLPRLASRQREA